MIRTLITPTSDKVILNIPKNLIGKKLEVIAFEIEEDKEVIKKKEKISAKSLRGKMSKEESKELQSYIKQVRDEWSHRI